MKKTRVLMRIICLLLIAIFVFTGCSSNNAEKSKESAKPDAAQSDKGSENGNTEAIKSDGEPIEFEVAAFEGAWGRKVWETACGEFEKRNPNVKTKLIISPTIHEQVRPRMVSGNPPDVMFMTENYFDTWAAISEGQVRALDDLLQENVLEGDQKFKDIFLPGMLEAFKSNGKQYMIPFINSLYGLWYNGKLFSENGWTEPQTIDEFLILCEKIKAKNIAPFVYQGIYPFYQTGFFIPLIANIGGVEALKKIDNLEPGAWKQPAVLEAITVIETMVKKGYFLKGLLAMNHTQSQMEFLNDRAAMIVNGTWFEGEMKDSAPKDFEYKFFPVPVKQAGQKHAVTIYPVDIFIPEKGKQPDLAKDFIKLLFTDTIRKEMAVSAGGVEPIKNATKGLENDLLPTLVQADQRIGKDDISIYNFASLNWYSTLSKAWQDAFTAVVAGQMTAEKFCDTVEAAAEKVRQDDSIKKYKVD